MSVHWKLTSVLQGIRRQGSQGCSVDGHYWIFPDQETLSGDCFADLKNKGIRSDMYHEREEEIKQTCQNIYEIQWARHTCGNIYKIQDVKQTCGNILSNLKKD